jgi:hypothetical protein
VWVFVEALLTVVILVFVFVSVRRVWWCVCLRVFLLGVCSYVAVK